MKVYWIRQARPHVLETGRHKTDFKVSARNEKKSQRYNRPVEKKSGPAMKIIQSRVNIMRAILLLVVFKEISVPGPQEYSGPGGVSLFAKSNHVTWRYIDNKDFL